MNDDHDSDLDLELEEFKKHIDIDIDLDIEDPAHPGSTALLPEDSIATATLTWQEKKNIALIFILYLIHVLPLAFSWWTMPILLRQQLDYSLIGTYLISQYPYSIKVLWSPLVQSTYLPFLGRRKSWIVPCFLAGGLVLFWLAYHQDTLIAQTAAGQTSPLFWLMGAWTLVMILGSNLRIALDDWSLDLFSQANVHLASTSVTLAEMSGQFFSFVLFLGFSSLGHPNAGAAGESVSTKSYFLITGVAWMVVGLLVLITQRDKSTNYIGPKHRSIRASYSIILHILKLPHFWLLASVHLTSMIGFMTNDSIAILQLVKNGFTDRDIAALASISIPLEFLGSILITKTFRKHHPLQIWRLLFPYRLLVAILTQCGVLLVNHYRAHHWRWFIALVPYLLSKQFEDMMFLSLFSFHAQIADPVYGGIYLPLLATTLNIRYDLMGFVYTKTIGWIDGGEGLGTIAEGETGEKARVVDGYQIVNLSAVLVAIPVFWFFLRPATRYLQGTSREEWRVGHGVDEVVGKGEYAAVGAEDEERERGRVS